MKDHFGKGETVLIDRKREPFPAVMASAISQQANGSGTVAFSHQEYFFVLRKMFQTFMFDMKEFAMDFLDLSVEQYLESLTWLTFVQSIIYKLDLEVERQASAVTADMRIDFTAARNDLLSFFKEHRLYDPDIQRCTDHVIEFLTFEKEQLHQDKTWPPEEIFRILKLKSADLEILRRVILKVHNLILPEPEMDFFRLLDTIREVFDDIRDYEEDRTLKSYNTFRYLQRGCDTSDAAVKILQKFLEKECERCLSLAKKVEKLKRKKMLAICERLEEEKNYYLGQLQQLKVFENAPK